MGTCCCRILLACFALLGLRRLGSCRGGTCGSFRPIYGGLRSTFILYCNGMGYFDMKVKGMWDGRVGKMGRKSGVDGNGKMRGWVR